MLLAVHGFIRDSLFDDCQLSEVKHFFLGMAHRGRLNVLANIFNKTYKEIFQEFEGKVFQESDFGVEYYIPEIEPEITPTLTIMENFEFNGVGACNIYSGQFDANSTDLITTEFSNTEEN